MISTKSTPSAAPANEGSAGAVLRRGLLALCGAGVLGTALELAMLRHWTSAVQLVPWTALAPLGLALGALAFRPGQTTVRAARAVALTVVVVAAFGIFEHVKANYDAGPLDRRYSTRWETMSEPSRWWAAVSGGVGPSPALAPAVLAQAAACLALATAHHPAARSNTGGEEPEPARR